MSIDFTDPACIPCNANSPCCQPAWAEENGVDLFDLVDCCCPGPQVNPRYLQGLRLVAWMSGEYDSYGNKTTSA
jgi:hypothetical protein